ncbi:hypothetical protein MMC20_000874 [Loxospora ochrophaea]|nr:hypothetical protein [Loxospora ochrophaea]
MAAAKLLERRTHIIPGKLKVSELFFKVPRDHSKVEGDQLRLFARSVERFEKLVDPGKGDEPKEKPWLLYLQGDTPKRPSGCGPGGSTRPPQDVAWTDPFLDKGYQILLLDQRGTGLSSTVTAKTLARQGGPAEQAEYLKHFRADSIVKDCEAIRKTLTSDYPEYKQKWSVLGQSFGGFCCIHYLSKFPEGLREVFTSGGLPPMINKPDATYERLYQKVAQRNEAYYQKYPEDIQRVKDIACHLASEDIKLPSGGVLNLLRLRQLGMMFGGHGGLDAVHDIILRLTSDLEQFQLLTRPSLAAVDAAVPFDNMVLYALVHEACYMQSGAASNWSADRLLSRFPAFLNTDPSGPHPIYFTGEMVSRSCFPLSPELSPLLPVADILAAATDWPDLYDLAQLARNTVPVYSVTYIDDMYVDVGFAQETAKAIKGCKTFVTNGWYHDALRKRSEGVVSALWELRGDSVD